MQKNIKTTDHVLAVYYVTQFGIKFNAHSFVLKENADVGFLEKYYQDLNDTIEDLNEKITFDSESCQFYVIKEMK